MMPRRKMERRLPCSRSRRPPPPPRSWAPPATATAAAVAVVVVAAVPTVRAGDIYVHSSNGGGGGGHAPKTPWGKKKHGLFDVAAAATPAAATAATAAAAATAVVAAAAPGAKMIPVGSRSTASATATSSRSSGNPGKITPPPRNTWLDATTTTITEAQKLHHDNISNQKRREEGTQGDVDVGEEQEEDDVSTTPGSLPSSSPPGSPLPPPPPPAPEPRVTFRETVKVRFIPTRAEMAMEGTLVDTFWTRAEFSAFRNDFLDRARAAGLVKGPPGTGTCMLRMGPEALLLTVEPDEDDVGERGDGGGEGRGRRQGRGRGRKGWCDGSNDVASPRGSSGGGAAEGGGSGTQSGSSSSSLEGQQQQRQHRTPDDEGTLFSAEAEGQAEAQAGAQAGAAQPGACSSSGLARGGTEVDQREQQRKAWFGFSRSGGRGDDASDGGAGGAGGGGGSDPALADEHEAGQILLPRSSVDHSTRGRGTNWAARGCGCQGGPLAWLSWLFADVPQEHDHERVQAAEGEAWKRGQQQQ